ERLALGTKQAHAMARHFIHHLLETGHKLRPCGHGLVVGDAVAIEPGVVTSLLSWAGHARADVMVQIDKSSQRMSVIVNGEHRYTWPVSTGIYGTPSGNFRPQSLARYHRSTLYNNAPMPYSIFYDGNFAIHGTTHVSQLGGPASRLHQAASVQ